MICDLCNNSAGIRLVVREFDRCEVSVLSGSDDRCATTEQLRCWDWIRRRRWRRWWWWWWWRMTRWCSRRLQSVVVYITLESFRMASCRRLLNDYSIHSIQPAQTTHQLPDRGRLAGAMAPLWGERVQMVVKALICRFKGRARRRNGQVNGGQTTHRDGLEK